MWIVTQQGFFSIVQHRDEPDTFLVRARVQGDLENMVQLSGLNQKVLSTPQADYPYRVSLSREELGRVMDSLGNDIDYPNFKSRIAAKTDQRNRSRVYFNVYHALEALQNLP